MEFKNKKSLYDHIVSRINGYAERWYCIEVESPNDTLRDLGFDSLDALEMQMDIEADLGFALEEADINISIMEYTDLIWNAINQRKLNQRNG